MSLSIQNSNIDLKKEKTFKEDLSKKPIFSGQIFNEPTLTEELHSQISYFLSSSPNSTEVINLPDQSFNNFLECTHY